MMTKRECAIIMAYTGTTMLAGDDLGIFYKYAEEISGIDLCLAPLYGPDSFNMLCDKVKKAAEPDFVKLCKEATDA